MLKLSGFFVTFLLFFSCGVKKDSQVAITKYEKSEHYRASLEKSGISYCYISFWAGYKPVGYILSLLPETDNRKVLSIIRLNEGQADDFSQLYSTNAFNIVNDFCSSVESDSILEIKSKDYPLDPNLDYVYFYNSNNKKTFHLSFVNHDNSDIYNRTIGIIKNIILEFEIADPRKVSEYDYRTKSFPAELH